MTAETVSLEQRDRSTVDALPIADGPLPSGGALEVRRLRDTIEACLFDRARDVVRIGRFTVLDRLGAGGMGVVYSAYDPGLDRKVAVKVLRREEADRDRDALVEEGRTLARLSHPNVVAVHEVGEHDGQVFVAMEHIDGESLDGWIRPATGPRPWREVRAVFDRAGRGLAAAHTAGLVHRDFKPHNVMLARDGAVKVLDFGLARAVPRESGVPSLSATGPHRHGSGSSTLTGALAGTPAYMSPEQLAGSRATTRSDQFSFCVALFEALHGQRPFPGRTLEEIAFAVLEGRSSPPPPRPRVPSFLRAVVARGLSVDPDARFSSMHELLAALGRDPVTRRRRVGAVLGSTVAVLAGVASWPEAAPAVAPCVDAGSAIAAVWNDEVRGRMHQGLLGSGSSRAESTWTRVAPQLDGYAAAWRASARDACHARAAYRESALTFDRRTACLRTRRASLAAVTDVLSSPDRELVDRAVSAVAAMPAVEGCNADDPAIGAFAAPQDPDTARTVDELRDRLARTRVLEEAGRYREAQAMAREVEASAEQLAFAPLRAEAAVVAGSVAMFAEAPEAADASLSRAIDRAVEAGHDVATIEAVAKRAFVRAELLRAPETARDDARHADALVVRHPGIDAHLRWLVANNVGVVRERNRDPDGARRRYKSALEHARAAGTAGRVDAIAALTNLAYVTNAQGDAASAAAYATHAIEQMTAVLGSDHPQLTLPLHARAEAALAQGRDAAAEASLRRALALHDAQETLTAAAAVDLHMLAGLARRRRRDDDAWDWIERAASIAEATLGPEHDVSVHMVLARTTIAVALGRLQADAADAELAVARRAAPSDATLALATALLDAGAVGPARELADRALRPDALPGTEARAPWWVLRARINLAEGLTRAATADLARATDSAANGGTAGGWTAALSLHRVQAELAAVRGDAGGVVAAREAALVSIPADADPDDPDRAHARLSLAHALLDRRSPDRARVKSLARAAAAGYRALGHAFDREHADARSVLARAGGG